TSRDPDPLQQHAPGCPPALEEIILRALAKDRDQRYHSAEDIVLDLEPILRELRQLRASYLLGESQQSLASEQLDAANTLIREALDLDPGNTTARRLRETVQKQIQRRAVKPKIDALVTESEGLLAAREFDSALERVQSALRLDRTDSRLQEL